jgi:hypothetical protein
MSATHTGKRTAMPFRILIFALALGAAAPSPVIAASAPAVPVPLQDLPVGETLGERLSRWLTDALYGLGLGSRPFDIARRHAEPGAREEDFGWLMSLAGYHLKEIESTIGVLPGLSLEFGQTRELSEADREYLERALERHARRNPGIIGTLQRMIVSGIVEASEIQGFGVEKVRVTLLPLPYVKLTLAPSDAPQPSSTTRVLRAIERLNQRLAAAAPG